MSFGYVSQDICAIRVLGYISMIVEWRAGSACAWFQRPAVKTKNCVCGSTIVLLWLDCANGNYTSTLCGCNGAVSLSNISFLFFQVSNFIRRLLLLTLCVCARCFFFSSASVLFSSTIMILISARIVWQNRRLMCIERARVRKCRKNTVLCFCIFFLFCLLRIQLENKNEDEERNEKNCHYNSCTCGVVFVVVHVWCVCVCVCVMYRRLFLTIIIIKIITISKLFPDALIVLGLLSDGWALPRNGRKFWYNFFFTETKRGREWKRVVHTEWRREDDDDENNSILII